MTIKKKIRKRLLWTLAAIFIFINVIAIFHAYKFTHFTNSPIQKTRDAKHLSTADKLKTFFLGIDNPRPVNDTTPSQPYEIIKLKSNKEIECWSIKTDSTKGTIILFHGFSGQKSSMLDKADVFLKLGYNTLLVDFMGSGGSEGNQTTIGYLEATEVKTCFDYVTKQGESNIYLFGTSMGAVAIMKAIDDFKISPNAIIIECPFGSMYETVCARFNNMHFPTFPMAGLLVFWGGIQNGFWAFGHKPTIYAKRITCPTLLMYGQQDEKVSKKEIDEIYANLNCIKKLALYPLAGHENYLIKYKGQWTNDIAIFLQENK